MEVAAAEHRRGEARHDGWGLGVEVAEHGVGAPAAEEADAVRIDAAAEDMRDSPSEVRIPLSTANVGKPQAGKQYIQSATFQLQSKWRA